MKGIQSDILEIEPEDDEVLVYSQPTNPIHVTRPKDSDLIGGAATAPRKKKAPPKRTTGTLVTIVGAGTVAAAFLMLFVVIGVLTLAIGLRLYLG